REFPDSITGRMVVHPGGHYLYVTLYSGNGVGGYTIDQATGALTMLPGAPSSSGGLGPQYLALDPTGRFLYVFHGVSISGFAIDPATGALEHVPGSPYATGFLVGAPVVHSSGDVMYGMRSVGGGSMG